MPITQNMVILLYELRAAFGYLNSRYVFPSTTTNKSGLDEQSIIGIRLFFLLSFSYLFLVYPWTIIGVFKSSKKAIIEKNKKTFAIIIQLIVILHICFYIGVLRHSYNYYARLFDANFGNKQSFVIDTGQKY